LVTPATDTIVVTIKSDDKDDIYIMRDCPSLNNLEDSVEEPIEKQTFKVETDSEKLATKSKTKVEK